MVTQRWECPIRGTCRNAFCLAFRGCDSEEAKAETARLKAEAAQLDAEPEETSDFIVAGICGEPLSEDEFVVRNSDTESESQLAERVWQKFLVKLAEEELDNPWLQMVEAHDTTPPHTKEG